MRKSINRKIILRLLDYLKRMIKLCNIAVRDDDPKPEISQTKL